jgi:hypothetical protein
MEYIERNKYGKRFFLKDCFLQLWKFKTFTIYHLPLAKKVPGLPVA